MGYFKHFQKIDYDVRGSGYTQKLTNLTQFAKIGTKILDDISLYSYITIRDGERPDNLSHRLYGTSDYYWTFFLINQNLVNSYNDWPKDNADLIEFSESKYPNLAAISSVISNSFDPIAGKFKIGETVTGGVTGATGEIVAKYPTDGYILIKPISGTFNSSGEGIYGLTTNDFLNTQSIVKAAYAPKYWVDDATGERTNRRTAGTSSYTNYNYEYDQNIEKSRIRAIKPKHIGEVVRVFGREMKNKAQ